MARLIGPENTQNFGENLFVNKAIEYMDDSNIIYWNRQLFGREFDVCILMPGKGILVVEVKGWREENILRIENSENVIVHTNEGEISSSPQKQARGYRFSLERFIKQNISKFPLVFQMVSLPQISRSAFYKKRLDVVMEEKFTILQDDLKDTIAFFDKLDQALREVNNWKRDPFNNRTMLEVRNLFEADINLVDEELLSDNTSKSFQYHDYDYSRFYFFSPDDDIEGSIVSDIVEQYFLGCKIYSVFSTKEQMISIIDALDLSLTKRGLIRNGDHIEIDFDNTQKNNPKSSEIDDSFMSFHCSFSVVNQIMSELPSFCIHNGEYTSDQYKWLNILSNVSLFNKDQFLIEHADPEKNIIIRAGAGTGKTYTMISRIGFICYSQNVPLTKMAERIVMITFTNDAADQMEEKLKSYFQNCYLITSRSEYLTMITLIDKMQISTIHSFAKHLISMLGTSFGYGIDLSITSSEFYRRRKISDILDAYIHQKELEYGKAYTDMLGMPVYAIRDSVLDFVEKLHNKSIDIEAIKAENFGSLLSDDSHKELHSLLAYVIPAVEKEYASELLENNKIHLQSMMAILNRFVNDPKNETRIANLKKDKDAHQFMFVDEFQDTDDSQIESLLRLSQILDYKLFLVGDIKQCIYRFRGAQEKAFDQLHIEKSPNEWLEFSLKRNYRTDSTLLDIFDKSFSLWGSPENGLLSYDETQDKLIGTRDYNGYLVSTKNKFFRRISAASEELRIPALVEEIKRLQKRIEYEENHGIALSKKEKSIAILVRENWQADLIRNECARVGISIHTNTGGDLYMSQPALDMVNLVNAMVHFDEADYLYNLATSNFFSLDVPKSNLMEIRKKIKDSGWRSKYDEKEQVNYLIHFMNLILANTDDKDNKWQYIITSLRTKPVLQVLRKIYSTLEPWKNYSSDNWKQHYYQLNVDLLFEQVINACNVDKLTINTLQEFLYHSVVSQVSVDSRIPPTDNEDVPIQCITVHKAKGLEYGHVILPFCSASIDFIKKSQLHVSTIKVNDEYHIGYSLSVGDTGQSIQNDFYDNITEKEEKSCEETRILYVAMTRAIRSFSWIEISGKQNISWQNLIESED